MEFTFVVSRGDGPYREDEFTVYTYVVSQDVATNTRLMTLNGPIHWSARSKILKFSRSHTHSLFLAMVSNLALVKPAVVRACRCLVYCTGSLPPGVVNCAGTLYSWRRVCFLPYSACAALLDVILMCMCMWLCMCKCTCCSCAGAVHVHLHALCVCSVQVYCGACTCMNFCFFFIYFSSLFIFSLHVSFAPLVFCATLLFFLFFFPFLFALFYVSPMYHSFESVTSHNVDQ